MTTIGNKTSYAMERAKARKQVTQLESDIAQLQREIGEWVYAHRTEPLLMEQVVQLQQIEHKEQEIVQLKTMIDELTELSRQAGLELEERYTCTNCNERYAELKRFCKKCGQQLID